MSDQPINTGGPAFPQTLVFSPEGQAHIAAEYFTNTEGMTLRDYFAAKAMNAMRGVSGMSDETVDWCASESYRIADAMLKAREVKQ